MKNGNGLKWAGIILTVVGAIIGVASTLVDNKKQEAMIKNEVSTQIAALVDNLDNNA